jgi:hypothetical protein
MHCTRCCRRWGFAACVQAGFVVRTFGEVGVMFFLRQLAAAEVTKLLGALRWKTVSQMPNGNNRTVMTAGYRWLARHEETPLLLDTGHPAMGAFRPLLSLHQLDKPEKRQKNKSSLPLLNTPVQQHHNIQTETVRVVCKPVFFLPLCVSFAGTIVLLSTSNRQQLRRSTNCKPGVATLSLHSAQNLCLQLWLGHSAFRHMSTNFRFGGKIVNKLHLGQRLHKKKKSRNNSLEAEREFVSRTHGSGRSQC